MVSAAGALALVGCVQPHVTESVAEAAVLEGRRYAKEVEAQSPFETVEIRWSEAEELMEKRNRTFIAAHQSYQMANEKKPLVSELTSETKSAVSASFGEALAPDALLKAMLAPATELPKQLVSLGKLKDLAHQIEQSAWEETAVSVDAELKMREEKVRLHRLLRMGELIDSELKSTETAPPPPAAADPKLVAAVDDWRASLRSERQKWLTEVRDLFDAEYHDVRFIRDDSGLPTYRDESQPDLGDWQRWCHLQRSQELVTALGNAHEKSKPKVPGTSLITNKLADMTHTEFAKPEPTRNAGSVRREVRSLLQSWRKMKNAQQQAARLEKAEHAPALDSLAGVKAHQTIFNLRRDEIEHSSVVWMLDESCWQ